MGTDAPAPEVPEAPMTDVLRPYQTDVVAQIEQAIAAGEKRILVVALTGSGKTVVASAIINRFTGRYRPVVVLAHRKEIIDQTSKKLRGSQITHGIVKAGYSPRPMERVQVASVQTLWVRAMRSEAMTLPPADPPGGRRMPSRHGPHLAQADRVVSRRHPDRTHGHTLPRRRLRARRHLHHHDRMPADPGPHRSRRLAGQEPRLRAGQAESARRPCPPR